MMESTYPETQSTPGKVYVKSGRRKGVPIGWLVSVRMFLMLILALQVVIIYFFFRPPFQARDEFNNQIVDEVSLLTSVNRLETPAVTQVIDAAGLKSANDIQAYVYSDVENGDYILGYSDKIIIYRQSENAIIYEGDSPGAIVARNKHQLVQGVIAAAKSRQVISADSQSIPQLLRAVSDVQTLKELNPEFYANAERGDLIASFSVEGVIVIYRPSTGQIVNSASSAADITPSTNN